MKIRHMLLIGALLVLGVSAGAGASRVWRWWTAPPAGYCPICRRPQHRESLVRFQAEGEGVTEACCLSCALSYGRQTSKAVTILSVTDHERGTPLDPNKATFVVGSDVSPCTHLHDGMQVGPERETYEVRWDRCLPNVLAFASRESAEAFRTQHGGHLQTLQALIGMATRPY